MAGNLCEFEVILYEAIQSLCKLCKKTLSQKTTTKIPHKNKNRDWQNGFMIKSKHSLPDNQSSIPGTHIRQFTNTGGSSSKGSNSSSLHEYLHTHVHTHNRHINTHILIKTINKKKTGIMEHVFNHSTEETGTDLCEFQSHLIYMWSSNILETEENLEFRSLRQP